MIDFRNTDKGPLKVNARTLLWVLLRAPDSYGLVLVLLLVSFIVTPLTSGPGWLVSRVLLQGGTMLFALHTSRVSRTTMRMTTIVFVVCVLLSILAALTGAGMQVEAQTEALIALMIAMSVPAMMRHILTSSHVTVETVIGALDVYIMFGMFFSSVYAALGHWSSTPFFTPPARINEGSYQFFSFVTLTTVGYGNLVPATQAGQSLAVLEALFGQIYLVTLVARLVSGLQPGSRHSAMERFLAEQASLREDQEADATSGRASAANPLPANLGEDRP